MISKESQGWGWWVCLSCIVLPCGEIIVSFLSSSSPPSFHPLATHIPLNLLTALSFLQAEQ